MSINDIDIYDPRLRALLEKAHDAGWNDCNERVESDNKGEAPALPWVIRRKMSVDRILAEVSPSGVYDGRIADARAATNDAVVRARTAVAFAAKDYIGAHGAPDRSATGIALGEAVLRMNAAELAALRATPATQAAVDDGKCIDGHPHRCGRCDRDIVGGAA